jgi:hypothetical protein
MNISIGIARCLRTAASILFISTGAHASSTILLGSVVPLTHGCIRSTPNCGKERRRGSWLAPKRRRPAFADASTTSRLRWTSRRGKAAPTPRRWPDDLQRVQGQDGCQMRHAVPAGRSSHFFGTVLCRGRLKHGNRFNK